MKEIEIIEIPLAECDSLTKLAVEFNDMRYYMGLQKDPKHQVSVLFKDLTWLRKHFGVDRNEGSPITFDSLNDGRRNEISKFKLALKENVPMRELNYWNFDENRWMTLKEMNKFRWTDEDKYFKELPRRDELSEDGAKHFQRIIDKGLYVLCKIVG